MEQEIIQYLETAAATIPASHVPIIPHVFPARIETTSSTMETVLINAQMLPIYLRVFAFLALPDVPTALSTPVIIVLAIISSMTTVAILTATCFLDNSMSIRVGYIVCSVLMAVIAVLVFFVHPVFPNILLM